MKTYVLHVTYMPAIQVIDYVVVHCNLDVAIDEYLDFIKTRYSDLYRMSLVEYENGLFVDCFALYERFGTHG